MRLPLLGPPALLLRLPALLPWLLWQAAGVRRPPEWRNASVLAALSQGSPPASGAPSRALQLAAASSAGGRRHGSVCRLRARAATGAAGARTRGLSHYKASGCYHTSKLFHEVRCLHSVFNVEECFAFCSKQHAGPMGLSFFGIENQDECWCAAAYDGRPAGSQACNYLCRGDDSPGCGGARAANIYVAFECSHYDEGLLLSNLFVSNDDGLSALRVVNVIGTSVAYSAEDDKRKFVNLGQSYQGAKYIQRAMHKDDAGTTAAVFLAVTSGTTLPTPVSDQCAIDDNRQRSGHDYKTIDGVTSSLECQKLCADEPQCKAWVLGKKRGQSYTNKCFLKNGIPTSTQDDCCYSGLKCDGAEATTPTANATAQVSPSGYSCESDINYLGEQTCFSCPFTKVPTLSGCAAKCNAQSGCQAFVYNKYQECYLKSDFSTKSRDNVVHGTVSCTKATTPTANATAQGGYSLGFTTNLPVTVHLAIDGRVTASANLTPVGFQSTGASIDFTDGSSMVAFEVYEKDFEPGQVSVDFPQACNAGVFVMQQEGLQIRNVVDRSNSRTFNLVDVDGDTVQYSVDSADMKFMNVGPKFQGGKFIQSGKNKDTLETGFTALRPVTVYVAIDGQSEHSAIAPEGFVDTGATLDFTHGSDMAPFHVYVRNFGKGQVRFHFKRVCMAGVFVVEQEESVELEAEEREVKLSSYGAFSNQTCGQAEGNALKIDNKLSLHGSLADCKLACWNGAGAMECHGFTYDKKMSMCTFCKDILDGEVTVQDGMECYFKMP